MGRLQLIAEAQKLLGLPYIYGAKGPASFDCSGFVTFLIKQLGGPDWTHTHNAALLHRDCLPIHEADDWLDDITSGAPHWPCPGVDVGDLVFYGPPGGIDHVMMVWTDGQVIGASGGNSDTLTPRPGASVHIKPRVDYRPDFVAYRAFPFTVTLEG